MDQHYNETQTISESGRYERVNIPHVVAGRGSKARLLLHLVLLLLLLLLLYTRGRRAKSGQIAARRLDRRGRNSVGGVGHVKKRTAAQETCHGSALGTTRNRPTIGRRHGAPFLCKRS